ncbi:MAG: BMP family ABC transporter substrate-binding protein [Clostridia bacterium]|jgi:basic membrane protein A and related proteins|nr:BMP family ABC transporter substrate-binding protein [Clostridia bacterium]MBT7122807.1 BMP family ABC transporter substrate-binding protein [Clostridia bacterium]
MKKLIILLALVMVASFVLAGCGGAVQNAVEDAVEDAVEAVEDAVEDVADEAADAVEDAMPAVDVKAGFIYIGPVGDGGFTYMHDQGRQAVEAMGVETLYLENVPEKTTECYDAIVSLIDEGCNVIFATSFGHMEATKNAAAEYPDVKFFHCSGWEINDTNLGNYFGRMYEPRYLSGIAAGYATMDNQIGYVAAFPIPEVIRGINAFTLGVRSVNPDATVQVVWTYTWYDPAIEKASAEGLLDAGCDVIAMHQDTPEPIAAAAAAGKYSVGYHSPMAAYGGDTYLTGAVWDLGTYYVAAVQSILDGTYAPESFWGGINDGTVLLEDFGPGISAEAVAAIEAAEAAIMDGSLHVFTGPIADQDGNIVVAEYDTMTDGDMLGMFFFVEGVIGSVD